MLQVNCRAEGTSPGPFEELPCDWELGPDDKARVIQRLAHRAFPSRNTFP